MATVDVGSNWIHCWSLLTVVVGSSFNSAFVILFIESALHYIEGVVDLKCSKPKTNNDWSVKQRADAWSFTTQRLWHYPDCLSCLLRVSQLVIVNNQCPCDNNVLFEKLYVSVCILFWFVHISIADRPADQHTDRHTTIQKEPFGFPSIYFADIHWKKGIQYVGVLVYEVYK